MVRSARIQGTELVTAEVLIEGQVIPEIYLVSDIEVTREINRIPRAQVTISDGSPSEETFAASESGQFLPGQKIEIRLGYQAKNSPVFKGLIVRHSLRVDPDGTSYLVLGCSDIAVKLTVARKSRTFLKMTDAAAMTRIIEDAGLTARVASTEAVLEHQLQAQSSDWDYLIARAEANGQVVIVDTGKVTIAKPAFDAPALSVEFGDSLVELDIEMDAVNQLPSVKASSWDPKTQKSVDAEASEPEVNDQGNVSGRQLAGVLGISGFDLQTARDLDEAALKAWANAQLLKSRLSRTRGTVTLPGNAAVQPGTLLQFEGVGARFNGPAYVSGLRHHASDGAWRTRAIIGLDRRWFADLHRDGTAAPAAALTPGIGGLQIAKVLQTHNDPEKCQRIKVATPLASPEDGIWVRIASPYAGDKMGITFLPETGDEVVLGFLNDDPNAPIVLGALHSTPREMPFVPDEKNTEKSVVTRAGLKIGFDDEKKVLTILTPGGHVVTLDDEKKTVTIVDSNKNSLTMADTGITLKSPKDVTVEAEGSVKIKGTAGITLSSPADVSVSGSNVKLSAEMSFSASGDMSASLSASGETSVSGTMVKIN